MITNTLPEKKEFNMVDSGVLCNNCDSNIHTQIVDNNGELELCYTCKCGFSIGHIPELTDEESKEIFRYHKNIIKSIKNAAMKINSKQQPGVLIIKHGGKEERHEFDRIELCKPYKNLIKTQLKLVIRIHYGEEVIVKFIAFNNKFRYYKNINEGTEKIFTENHEIIIERF